MPILALGAILKPVGALFSRIPWQVYAALAIALAGLLLVHNRNHWKAVAVERQAEVAQAKSAFDQTVANYRAAAAQATADDKANADRVKAEQLQINQESSNEYETRIAAARAAADKLRQQLASQTNSGSPAKPSVPGISTPSGGPAQAPGKGGFSIDDRLTATDQAIQLDEIIKWVKKQAGVDPNSKP